MEPPNTIDDTQSERIVNDPGRGFLAPLTPSVFAHYPYWGKAKFLQDFQHEVKTSSNTHEWLVITNVTPEIFTTAFLEPSEPPFSAWSAYDQELNLLLVRMTNSAAHEVAGAAFDHALWKALILAGLDGMITTLDSTTIVAATGRKQADKAYQPREISQATNWPSVVLEVAYSESAAKLQADVRFWLHNSNDHVKVVFAIKVKQRTPMITIEKWKRDPNGQGYIQQRAIISRHRGNVTIHGAPITIEFEDLFLRSGKTRPDKDIELDVDMLRDLAAETWSKQEFPA